MYSEKNGDSIGDEIGRTMNIAVDMENVDMRSIMYYLER